MIKQIVFEPHSKYAAMSEKLMGEKKTICSHKRALRGFYFVSIVLELDEEMAALIRPRPDKLSSFEMILALRGKTNTFQCGRITVATWIRTIKD